MAMSCSAGLLLVGINEIRLKSLAARRGANRAHAGQPGPLHRAGNAWQAQQLFMMRMTRSEMALATAGCTSRTVRPPLAMAW